MNLSIVIPVYNEAENIGEILKRVQSAKLAKEIQEIIVVDDGSPDDVAGTVKPFGSQVRLLQPENGGPCNARNTGLSQARGQSEKFLDADDWLLPDCLEKQLKCYAQT